MLNLWWAGLLHLLLKWQWSLTLSTIVSFSRIDKYCYFYNVFQFFIKYIFCKSFLKKNAFLFSTFLASSTNQSTLSYPRGDSISPFCKTSSNSENYILSIVSRVLFINTSYIIPYTKIINSTIIFKTCINA